MRFPISVHSITEKKLAQMLFISSLITVMVAFLPIRAITPPAFAACTAGEYQVQGVGGNNEEYKRFGVKGWSRVWNTTVEEDSVYVNSVWIRYDANNLVEIGWHEKPDGTREYFR